MKDERDGKQSAAALIESQVGFRVLAAGSAQ